MSMEKSLDRPGEDDIGTYHEFVRVQSSRNPCLLNLDTFLSNPENNYDCQITVLDFHGGKQTPTARDHVLPGGLPAMLRKDNAEESSTLQGRILIIEDLTKELVELLGVELKIDPLFFAMHLHVSQKGQHPRQAPNDATLPSRLLTQDYINISFQRSVVNEKKRDSWSRYVRDTVISRKLVFLPSTNVGLIQHCVSILRVKLEDGFWIALVLVDPPIGNTYFSSDRKETKSKVEIKVEPYLGAYEDFTERPDSSSTTTSFTLRNNGMMKDLEMFWTQSPPVGFDAQNPTLHSLAHFPLRIVAAEWVKYVAVMNHCLIGHEYTKHDELGLDDFDTRLQELQSWRRRSMLSQQKVRAVLRQLQSWMITNPHDTALLQPLITDYEYISGNIEEYGRMLESTVPVLTSVIQITQTRRAFTETTNITRLTILALVFVPLSYIASLFSMSESFAPGSHLFWVYFIVAVPVTMLVAIFARARGPQSWRMFGWLRRERRKHDIEAIPV